MEMRTKRELSLRGWLILGIIYICLLGWFALPVYHATSLLSLLHLIAKGLVLSGITYWQFNLYDKDYSEKQARIIAILTSIISFTAIITFFGYSPEFTAIETLSDCLYLLVILFQTAAVIAVSPFTIIALFMPLCPVYRLIKQFVNEIMQKNFIDKLLFKQPIDDNKDKIKWK